MNLVKKIFVGGVSDSGKDSLIDPILNSLESIEYFHFAINMKDIAKKDNIEFVYTNFEILEKKAKKRLDKINRNIIINGHYSIPVYENFELIKHRIINTKNFDAYVLLDANPYLISTRRSSNDYKNEMYICDELKKERENFLKSSKGNYSIIINECDIDKASLELKKFILDIFEN